MGNDEDEEATNSREKAAPPVAKFRCGAVSAAIWEKEIQTQYGPKKIQNTSISRKYKDKKTGEWKSSQSIPTDNLMDASLLLEKCYLWIKMKEVTDAPQLKGVETY